MFYFNLNYIYFYLYFNFDVFICFCNCPTKCVLFLFCGITHINVDNFFLNTFLFSFVLASHFIRIYLQRNWCIWLCVCVFLQFASTVLGEHFEKPSLHVWRSCDGSGRRLSVCHRPDLHGCLHQDWAQTNPGEQQRLKMYFINPIISSWLSVSCSLSWSLFHRSPPATNCFMQRKSPLTRRWSMSRFLFCSTVCTYAITAKWTIFSLLFSYYKGVRQMVPVSDQDMNTHLAEISRVC